ncbi:MAG: nucleotidyltransferase family protein [Deltaproteobacteria bacterium]|nr:nucleotidyltransferase family protein [Deltaproteobacteria bacterium]
MRASPPPHLGPDERKLIINCARLELQDALREQTRALIHKPLAWDAILFHAELHSVAPLLYRSLKRLNGFDQIPTEARQALLRLFHRAGYQNRKFSGAVQEIAQSFAAVSIPVIVLKGLSLVELIYGSLSLRPLIDLNLLIPKEMLRRAMRLLLQMGYSHWTRYPLRRFYEWLYSQNYLVRAKEFDIHLLLQWDVVNWPKIHAIDLRRVWADAQSARLSGCDARVLSPVDFLLYLCLQPGKQGFLNNAAVHEEDPATLIFTEWTDNRLIRFTDIYETIRHYQATLDWEILIHRAKASGFEGSVYTNLLWVQKLYGQAVPDRVLSNLRPSPPRFLRRWIFEALAQTRNHASTMIFRRWWLKKPKLAQLRWVKRLDLLEFIFPRQEELRLRYQFRWKKMARAACLLHSGKAIARCAFGVLPLIYCLLTRRKPSTMQRRQEPLHAMSDS